MADTTLSRAIADQVSKGREVSFHASLFPDHLVYQVRVDQRVGTLRGGVRVMVDEQHDDFDFEEATIYAVLWLGELLDRQQPLDAVEVVEAV